MSFQCLGVLHIFVVIFLKYILNQNPRYNSLMFFFGAASVYDAIIITKKFVIVRKVSVILFHTENVLSCSRLMFSLSKLYSGMMSVTCLLSAST